MRTTFSELAAAVGRCERCTLDYSAHPHRDCALTYIRPARRADAPSIDSLDYRGDTEPPVLECDECGAQYPIGHAWPKAMRFGLKMGEPCPYECGGTLREAQ